MLVPIVGGSLQIWQELSSGQQVKKARKWRERLLLLCLQRYSPHFWRLRASDRQRTAIILWILLSQSCILKATGCSMFPLCSLIIVLGLCLLYLCMGENEERSGQLHWKYRPNLGTTIHCLRRPPHVWDWEPFKPVTEPVMEVKLYPLTCSSSRACHLSKAWPLCTDAGSDLIYKWHSFLLPFPSVSRLVTSLAEG